MPQDGQTSVLPPMGPVNTFNGWYSHDAENRNDEGMSHSMQSTMQFGCGLPSIFSPNVANTRQIFPSYPSEPSCFSESSNYRYATPSKTTPDYYKRPSCLQFQPGMQDVPGWLKALRLHKYTAMFQELSYDEMLNLNEAELERRQVTKGARKKILQSIQKLKNRSEAIRDIVKGLSSQNGTGCLRCAILNLQQLLVTPIRRYQPRPNEPQECIDGTTSINSINDENIPALLMRFLCAVHSLVFPVRSGEGLEDEYLLMMFKIFDKVANNESFSDVQRRKAVQLKKQARRYTSPQELRRNRGSVVHTAGRCDNCQHQPVPTTTQYEYNCNKNPYYQDRFIDVTAPLRQRPRMPFNPHTLQNLMATQNFPVMPPVYYQYMANMPRDDHGRRSCAHPPLTCDKGDYLSQMMQPVPSTNDPLSNIPQYRSATSSNLLDELPNLHRPITDCWNSAIFSEIIRSPDAKHHNDSNMDKISNLWSLDNQESSDYSSSSTSERSSDAGSPRSRPSRENADIMGLLEQMTNLHMNTKEFVSY